MKMVKNTFKYIQLFVISKRVYWTRWGLELDTELSRVGLQYKQPARKCRSSCYFSAIFSLKALLWNTNTRTSLNVASETRWSIVIIAIYLLSGFECMLPKLFMSLYYLKDCKFAVCRFKMLLHLKGKKCRMSVFYDPYQFFDCGKYNECVC